MINDNDWALMKSLRKKIDLINIRLIEIDEDIKKLSYEIKTVKEFPKKLEEIVYKKLLNLADYESKIIMMYKDFKKKS